MGSARSRVSFLGFMQASKFPGFQQFPAGVARVSTDFLQVSLFDGLRTRVSCAKASHKFYKASCNYIVPHCAVSMFCKQSSELLRTQLLCTANGFHTSQRTIVQTLVLAKHKAKLHSRCKLICNTNCVASTLTTQPTQAHATHVAAPNNLFWMQLTVAPNKPHLDATHTVASNLKWMQLTRSHQTSRQHVPAPSRNSKPIHVMLQLQH